MSSHHPSAPGFTPDLTERQRDIRDFIVDCVKQRGYPPTIREIGLAVGLSSTSSVHAQLENLVRLGVLRTDPGPPWPQSPRAITVITPPEENGS